MYSTTYNGVWGITNNSSDLCFVNKPRVDIFRFYTENAPI